MGLRQGHRQVPEGWRASQATLQMQDLPSQGEQGGGHPAAAGLGGQEPGGPSGRVGRPGVSYLSVPFTGGRRDGPGSFLGSGIA